MEKEDRPYWNIDIEPFLNRLEMKKLQLEKLKIMTKGFYVDPPFDKKGLNDAGINTDKKPGRFFEYHIRLWQTTH